MRSATVAAKAEPIELVETAFSLKAAATQVVSIIILMYHLVPFFRGKPWTECASTFVGRAFDLPRLALDLNMSFGWPMFERPELYFHLALGVFVFTIAVLIRILKGVQRYFHSSLVMGPVSLLEEAVNLVFSWSTWAPFAAVADRYKVGIELAKEAWREGRLRDLFKPQKKKDRRGNDTHEEIGRAHV